MNRRAVGAVTIGLVLTALGGVSALAADLPLKAPLKPIDFNPFWAEIDYLAWSVSGDKLPTLVTTAPAGTPFAIAGVLGQPTTTVLFGNSSVNTDWRSGGRVTAGYWFDPQRSRGIEASFFGLENIASGFAADSNTYSILARPFANAATGTQDALLVAFPGVATGSVNAVDTSRLLGAGALYRQDVGMWSGQRVSALIGYRYLRSSDSLWITDTGNAPGFGTFIPTDSFKAVSNFHGLDLGLTGEWRSGPWSLEWRGKVALGAIINSADIRVRRQTSSAVSPRLPPAASSPFPAISVISSKPVLRWCRKSR